MLPSDSRAPRVRSRWPIAKWTAVVCGAAVAIMLGVPSSLDYRERAHLVLRVTGEASTVFFLAAYVAAPLYRLGRSTLARWLVSNRRDIGIAFAAIQLYHAALLAV